MELPERLWVTYLELRDAPAPAVPRTGPERIRLEAMGGTDYLELYRRVGESLRWDTRLDMPIGALESLLAGGSLNTYVLRAGEAAGMPGGGTALGFCEFERQAFPEIELKHFGLVPEAQGRGLGPWLLSTALGLEWASGVSRIWLHTDTWDHPAAAAVYQRAGFRIYDRRYQAVEGL
ncbi:MAG TPA: GNAT family N-acetyltransferase [Steroidobacteraceae bacterium]|nr:GNAT family N-acetyltransferase [Steroidobacteraceae bacterium]